MFLWGRNLYLDGNTVKGTELTGIWLETASSGPFVTSSQIVNNHVIDNALIEGWNTQGTRNASGNAVQIYGDSNTISGNTVERSGYNGIRFNGHHTRVENNLISYSCMTIDDCAGIYTENSSFENLQYLSAGSVIRKNIIRHSVGNSEGWKDGGTRANGIYIDQNTRNVRAAISFTIRTLVSIYRTPDTSM